MGRKFPADNISLIHPVVYLSFLVAGFAASIGIIIAICSFRFRRKWGSRPRPPPPQQQSDPLDLNNSSSPPTNNVGTTTEPVSETETGDNDAAKTKELPLPPSMVHTNDSFLSNNLKKTTSERRATSFSLRTLSIKIPRSLSVARHGGVDHKEKEKEKEKDKEDKSHKGGKLKAEDSVWMKTIILGEKCNPDEDENPVIYEGKGKRISAYHPKSVSRQFSFLDPDALSVPQTQTQEDRMNNNI